MKATAWGGVLPADRSENAGCEMVVVLSGSSEPAFDWKVAPPGTDEDENEISQRDGQSRAGGRCCPRR